MICGAVRRHPAWPVLVALCAPGVALAQQSLTWDVNGAQAATGGSGLWDTTSHFWSTGATWQAWNNPAFDNAVFAGSAGTVALSGSLNAHGLLFSVGGYTLSGGTLVFGGINPTVTTQVAVTTVNSVLSGAAGFTKDGTATLALGGISTGYTGVTQVNAGTLRVDSANALGLSTAAGNLVLGNGATFLFNSNFTHNYTLTGGTVSIQGGLFTWSGAPTLTAATTLNLNSLVSGGTLSGNLADTGANVLSLIRNGPGRVVLTGANSYTGATTIVAGHLQIGSAGALSTGSNLVFSGASGAGGDLELTATSGNFTRSVGTLTNQVQWTGDGGFMSSGAARIVNLGGAGAQVAWGSGSFVPSGSRLILGTTSNHTLDFQNAINVGSGVRSVQGDGGTLSGHARLSGVVSGTGGVNQVGNGILELTAANTYSGGTVFTSGTVLVAANSNLGAVTGGLVFEGGILQNTGAFSMARGVTVDTAGGTFRTDADLVAAGDIAGSGRMTKAGSATLTLTGAATHSGGTTVAAGVLQIGNGATAGSLGGDVLNSAVVAFDRSDTSVFAGSIGGSGSLQQLGTGTLVLGGQNSYTGGTVISQGTLQVGNGAASGSIVGNVIDNGALVFDRSGATAFAGVVSGTGSLTQSGAGVLVLSGQNVHTGGTIVAAGMLQMSGAGTLGIATGTTTVGPGTLDLGGTVQAQLAVVQTAGVIANGTLHVFAYQLIGGAVASSAAVAANTAFDLRAGTVNGVLAGNGAVSKTTAGSVALTGANSYTGGTAIHAGTLAIGDGISAGSIVGNILDNGMLAFNLPGVSDFVGVITGGGIVEQRGPGTLRLTGNSAAFVGSTSVVGGTLAVDGVLGGTTTVLSGGRLAGNGTLGTTHVAAGATLTPGSPFGTLTIAGNASFAAGSTFEVKADPAGAVTLLHVTGAANITGGTVSVVAQGSIFQTGALYTLLAADGGRVGQFAALTETLPLLDMALSYGPNTVYLAVARNSTTLCSLAVTRNQCATSTTGASLGSGNAVYESVVNLPHLPAIQDALDRLSGEIHAAANGELLEGSRFVREAVMKGMGSRTWGSLVDNSARATGDGNAAATRSSTRGFFVGGTPWTVGPARVGVAAGYTGVSLDASERASSMSSDNFHGALYAMARAGAIDLRAGAAASLHRLRTHRVAAYPGFSDTDDAVRNANTAQLFGEAGYPLSAGSLVVEPFAGLAYVKVRAAGFSESGGFAAVRGAQVDQAITYTTLGINLANTASPFGRDASVRAKAAWRHAQGALQATAQNAIGGSTSFTVAGLPIATNTLVLDTGLDFRLARGVTAGIGYNGQFASGRRDNGLRADLAWTF